MQKDLPNKKDIFSSICFIIYILYNSNNLKKCEIRKYFGLILNNTNINLKWVYYS